MNSHKTAISRTNLSKPMTIFRDAGLLDGPTLDFGCGKGKDVEILGIDGYDPHYFPKLPVKWYNTVTMNYVINTLDTHYKRLQAIRDAWKFVDVGGILIITSRTYKDITNNAIKHGWKPHAGGYITGKGTFQIGFMNDQLREFLSY